MKVIDYLRARHPGVFAISRREAKVLGIPYPLQKGWVGRYGDQYITDEQAEDLCRLKLANARVAKAHKRAISELFPNEHTDQLREIWRYG